ncbi:MAG TPA: hypothetical protein P5042_05975, partial [Candidatus Izemoplasmatales bacterium]|nr:hypothetical protein [Candidatus Izemoplasmatales bacterium]
MKKKLLFTMVLFVAMVFLTGEVFAYNPNCLPGGDNYLDPENFILSGDQYVTKDPFLVKPYTDYILSFPCEYERVLPTIKIEMYENDNYMDELEFNERTFSYNSEYQVTYISFKTLSNTNYLGVLLYDGGYITENGIEVFMLEEGTEYDGYEPYIDGTIADTDAPYFQGAGMIVSYVDTPITVAEIQSALTAYDAVDGDVTASIVVVNDAYSANSSVLGAYTVTFAVSDSSGNQNEVDVTVNVVDVMEPVFGELAEVIAVYPNAYTAEDIRAMLTASDNYDGDISSSITITNDNYTANNQIVGSYQMDFSVTDSSGNGATHSLVVKVVDQEAPVVTGTANITIGYDSPISVESVRSGLSVIDNYDQSDDLSLILSSDNYTANSETIGTYSMVFEVYDSSNNRTEKAITLTVIDNVAPAVYFDS